ncbi:glycosyltransferase [Limnovirga soli]|uniref:Glycosyltransferase n=1 Tax=Limnovirga soli TaxID=2656915 RepID=A0A8J8FAE2_9BACT|nr:glycosyltransferase [Limnovirga soli]NNV54373.1 glycosyltransferase [Limnovirga soli]
MKKLIIIGQAHPIRGGIASFNERLALECIEQGIQTSIYTFSYQYPGFLFPGKTQYTTEPLNKPLDIKVCINSINPLKWISVGKQLQKENADVIVFAYWLPLMGPALGTIARIAKRNSTTKIICIAHNAIPHEKRPGDNAFTYYFASAMDAFIALSTKVKNDLATFTHKSIVQTVHPLFDHFGSIIPVAQARKQLGIHPDQKIILFFGFIRKYKGLDILIEAIHILKQQAALENIKLMIAGEFYDDEQIYQQQIDAAGIREDLIINADFIAEDQVKFYLCAADFVIQPYRNATQSGVTPLAYHFEKPMLVTNVGGLPDLVPDGKAGLVCEPHAEDIAKHILRLYQLGTDYFLPGLRYEKQKYSWNILVNTIKQLAQENL